MWESQLPAISNSEGLAPSRPYYLQYSVVGFSNLNLPQEINWFKEQQQ
jgi:hypothetical protein